MHHAALATPLEVMERQPTFDLIGGGPGKGNITSRSILLHTGHTGKYGLCDLSLHSQNHLEALCPETPRSTVFGSTIQVAQMLISLERLLVTALVGLHSLYR